jgi:hypothetical protein
MDSRTNLSGAGNARAVWEEAKVPGCITLDDYEAETLWAEIELAAFEATASWKKFSAIEIDGLKQIEKAISKAKKLFDEFPVLRDAITQCWPFPAESSHAMNWFPNFDKAMVLIKKRQSAEKRKTVADEFQMVFRNTPFQVFTYRMCGAYRDLAGMDPGINKVEGPFQRFVLKAWRMRFGDAPGQSLETIRLVIKEWQKEKASYRKINRK